MASLVKLTLRTLSSAVHQAATLSARSLISVPRLIASTNLPQTGGVIPQRQLPLSSSFSTLSCVPRVPLLQNAEKCATGAQTQSCRSYHVRVALKKRCSSCFFVRRKGRLYVECKAKPRHKQMQVMSKRKVWKEDYSEGLIHRAIHWNYNRDYQYYKLGNTQYARHDWLKGKIGVTV